ncbi:E4 [Canis familiaris papillomavirus 11]|uniref:E4 n=1 Tax=Canis familiaris papillomavirus 11 TaxID=1091166 RepID=G4XF80_9PAPI|nr:E4 [Canis familiaris papillomavirus 11]
MNQYLPLTLLPAPPRPPTLVQRLLELLTGTRDGWPENLELQDLADRETGEPRYQPVHRPPTPQIPSHSPPLRPRRRRKNQAPVRRPPSWEENLQSLGACAPTPPLGSPVETPEEFWFPSTQDSPPTLSPCPFLLSPCPGASPPHSVPDSPRHCRRRSHRNLDLDQPLPPPTPLPLPSQRPTLLEQKQALEKALHQVAKDAFQLHVDIDADLDTFFGKLGIAPRR